MASHGPPSPEQVSAAELRPYLGQWVAIVGSRVVAAATELRELRERVARQGIENPAYRYLPRGRFVG